MNPAERIADNIGEDERYRLLIESVTDYAIYMLTPAGIVATWNAGAARFKGYESHEVIGEHFSRFYLPEDQASGLPARALAVAAKEGKFESEGWRMRKGGARFWAHVVIDPIRDRSGNLLGFTKITRDLTARREAEERLRRSEEQFRILVQGVTDYALYMLDPDGRITSWNVGAERIKGYGADEVIGQHFSLFYLPDDRERMEPQRALSIAAAEGRFEKEGQRVRKNGSAFWAHVVIDAIHHAETGKLIGFAKITRDISQRREAELALAETREALFQSQKMEALGQLTGGVAHDFNNLLAVILGNLELLRKRSAGDPRSVSLITNAVHAAQRGAALTKRMLTFARREALSVSPLSIADLVGEMKDLVERSIGSGIEVSHDIAPDVGIVLADRNQLEMALLNLVVNARDAMPDGGTLRIAARNVPARAEGGKPFVCLSVSDTGIGMDEATMARAIDPFFTTKGVGEGTGLGLSMVHSVAEQLGGSLKIFSRKGAGTTVEIRMPAAENAAA